MPGGRVDDFYTEYLQELPLDEWGHPVLPMPEKFSRREYEKRLLQAADRAGEDAALGARQR